MNPEEVEQLVQYRLEQARTALEDARYLQEGVRSAQSIINRAYYAMFYSVLALLQRHPKIPSKHTGVISLFDTEFVLKGRFPKELSRVLHRAFQLRQSSDYRATGQPSNDRAAQVLEQAEGFVQAISAELDRHAGNGT